MRNHIKARYILGTTVLLFAFLCNVAFGKGVSSDLDSCLKVAKLTRLVMVERDKGSTKYDILSRPEALTMSPKATGYLNFAIGIAFSEPLVSMKPDDGYVRVSKICFDKYGQSF